MLLGIPAIFLHILGKDDPSQFRYLFASAHLAFCAAAIRALPSALIFLRWGLAAGFELTGLPRFGEGVWPFNSARAFSSRAISASIL